MKRANEFGTKKNCDSSVVSSNVLAAFLAAQTAINKGDTAAVQRARDAVQKEIIVNYMQARAPARLALAVLRSMVYGA